MTRKQGLELFDRLFSKKWNYAYYRVRKSTGKDWVTTTARKAILLAFPGKFSRNTTKEVWRHPSPCAENPGLATIYPGWM